jgi:hypothetical protein
MTTLPPLLQKEIELFEKTFDLFASSNEYPKIVPPVITVEILKQMGIFLTASHTRVLTALLGEIGEDVSKEIDNGSWDMARGVNQERRRLRSLIHSLLGDLQ